MKITQTDDDHVLFDHAWTAPIWFEPEATPVISEQSIVTLAVNRMTEEAVITNVGQHNVDLIGWRLLSVRGDQFFDFHESLVLEPGESVIVTSGPNAENQLPSQIKWTSDYIWNNSGDEGRLIDLHLNVVATSD